MGCCKVGTHAQARQGAAEPRHARPACTVTSCCRTLLAETLTVLLRNTEYVSYASSGGRVYEDIDTAEAKFNEVALAERAGSTHALTPESLAFVTASEFVAIRACDGCGAVLSCTHARTGVV